MLLAQDEFAAHDDVVDLTQLRQVAEDFQL